jgi:hypothetical protein
MSQAHTALFCDAFPCNPRPFLSALRDHLEEGGPIGGDHAKRILYTLVAILRGQLAWIELGVNASFLHRQLSRMPGRDSPLAVIASMEREALGFDTPTTKHQWWSSVASLIFFAWGDQGRLDLGDEWSRLHAAWQTEEISRLTA